MMEFNRKMIHLISVLYGLDWYTADDAQLQLNKKL